MDRRHGFVDVLTTLLAVALVTAIVAGVVMWDVSTCEERGPPETQWTIVSCGKDCWTAWPETTRPCVRREP